MSPQKVIIIGAGYTGLTAAIMLADLGLDVVILERAASWTAPDPAEEPSRLLALAMGSIRTYESLGMSAISRLGQPINHIRVWDYTSDATLDYAPEEVDASCFGYMIEEYKLRTLLMEAVARYPNITIHYGVTVAKVRQQDGLVWIEAPDLHLSAGLLVIADGRHSTLCKRLGIEVQAIDYQQQGIVCDVQHTENHHGVAVEQFFPNGPFAILPKLGGYKSSIVWVEPQEVAESVRELSLPDIEMLIASRFAGYLGEVKLASKVRLFALKLVVCRQYYAERVAVVGDAAHAIHPLAGQGFNLAVRDITCLVDRIKKQLSLGLEIGACTALEEYDKIRQVDSNVMVEATHSLNSLFVSNFLPLSWIRGAGMTAIDKFMPLKRQLIKYAMGMHSLHE